MGKKLIYKAMALAGALCLLAPGLCLERPAVAFAEGAGNVPGDGTPGVASAAKGAGGGASGNGEAGPASVSGNALPVSGEGEDGASGNGAAETRSPADGGSGPGEAYAETEAPIFSYGIVDVIAPIRYAVALNPFGLLIDLGGGRSSTSQVVSRNYGILNKSSTDQLVTVTLTVEDLNQGKISFVGSEEEAREAGEGSYAVYLAVVPAADGAIGAGGKEVGQDSTAADLSDVEMEAAAGEAVALHEGENKVTFKLSKAEYGMKEGEEVSLDNASGNHLEDVVEMAGLAPDGKGVTAFTFDGAVNTDADWGELGKGIRISVAYTYETAGGSEEILEGTDALVAAG